MSDTGASAPRTIDPQFSAAERVIYHATFKACMLRAADIIDRITQSDVEHAQLEMHRQGVSLANLAKLDRATLASAHLRSIANAIANSETQEPR